VLNTSTHANIALCRFYNHSRWSPSSNGSHVATAFFLHIKPRPSPHHLIKPHRDRMAVAPFLTKTCIHVNLRGRWFSSTTRHILIRSLSLVRIPPNPNGWCEEYRLPPTCMSLAHYHPRIFCMRRPLDPLLFDPIAHIHSTPRPPDSFFWRNLSRSSLWSNGPHLFESLLPDFSL